MRCLLVLVATVTVVIADPPDSSDSVHHRPLIRSTTLGGEAGTPDPLVSEDVRRLLKGTNYTNEQIHYMPLTVTNPDCYVTTYVIKEQRHGGRCSRMAGGLPFCAVKNYVYPNHPDCVNSESRSSGGGAWGSSRWGPFFSRTTDIDPPTESTGDEDDDDVSASDNPRFRARRNVKNES